LSIVRLSGRGKMRGTWRGLARHGGVQGRRGTIRLHRKT
jgi:hypothetical protein